MKGIHTAVFLCSFTALVLNGCAQSSNNAPASPAPTAGEAPGGQAEACKFRFSTAPSATGTNADNWCRGDFSEALPMGAEQNAPNSVYYFFAKEGSVYKVNVALGKTTFSTFIRPAGQNMIEVFSASNYPECLSSQSNYTLSDSGYFLDYNNQKFISVNMHAEPVNGAVKFYIECPPETQYGISINRCANCGGK